MRLQARRPDGGGWHRQPYGRACTLIPTELLGTDHRGRTHAHGPAADPRHGEVDRGAFRLPPRFQARCGRRGSLTIFLARGTGRCRCPDTPAGCAAARKEQEDRDRNPATAMPMPTCRRTKKCQSAPPDDTRCEPPGRSQGRHELRGHCPRDSGRVGKSGKPPRKEPADGSAVMRASVSVCTASKFARAPSQDRRCQIDEDKFPHGSRRPTQGVSPGYR